MSEQRYIIDDMKSFELKDIFECGQCFRWNKLEDDSYTGIVRENVINVKKQNGKIIFSGNCSEKIKLNNRLVDSLFFSFNADFLFFFLAIFNLI